MLDKYIPNFETLTDAQAAHLAGRLTVPHAEDWVPSGRSVYDLAASAGLDQADVIMSVASDPSPVAVQIVEALIGRPLEVVKRGVSAFDPVTNKLKTVEGTEPARQRGRSSAAVRRSDPRVIAGVVSNPKKPGSATHARFELYRPGMTVDQVCALGVTTADVRYDVDHGFITLEKTS